MDFINSPYREYNKLLKFDRIAGKLLYHKIRIYDRENGIIKIYHENDPDTLLEESEEKWEIEDEEKIVMEIKNRFKTLLNTINSKSINLI
jgi:hypothetical protein